MCFHCLFVARLGPPLGRALPAQGRSPRRGPRRDIRKMVLQVKRCMQVLSISITITHRSNTLTFLYSNKYKRISYQNTTKTLTFVTLFITLFHFKHSFLTNETLNSHINHIYIIFTYISTNERIFITIYNQITIKQHTSKIIIKTRV